MVNAHPYRDQREEDILHRLAAEFIQKESNRTALVTVTNITLGDKGKNVTVFFTVLPENKEAGVLDFLKRKRSEFRDYIKDNSRLGLLPFVDFAIDGGEKNRQIVDRLI
jgi:ribosome-binding factor A